MHQLSIWGRSQTSPQESQSHALSSQTSFQHLPTNLSIDDSSTITEQLKVMFCQGVKLADQKHRFKTYTQCFVGS